MSRAKWKGPYSIDLKLLNRNTGEKSGKLIMPRNIEIVPKFIGFTFMVHNGKNYSEITVTENMLGHKLGEFCFTRAKFFFKKKPTKLALKKKIKK